MFNAKVSTPRLVNHGLTLYPEANDRGCNDVWVSSRKGHISSYACATDTGYLDDVYKLSQSQLTWLNSQQVQNWLDDNNY